MKCQTKLLPEFRGLIAKRKIIKSTWHFN